MKTEALAEKIGKIAGISRISQDEKLSGHTTFQAGGPAKLFAVPEDPDALAELLRLFAAEKEPFFILGNGSNVLFRDEGFEGIVISMKALNRITVDADTGILEAEGGAALSAAAGQAAAASLTGMEFAAGIPGTIGGAVVMNAGAYGGEMKQIVEEVTLLNEETGEIMKKTGAEMQFGYRESLLKREPAVVLRVRLRLQPGDPEKIRETMAELSERRRAKQPLEYPSAGSTFKRPEGYFAGKLIEDAGLKGFSVGGASVSEKHAGFVINRDHATASELITLIQEVQRIVLEKQGVLLEPEVLIL